jgi:hypothetical protein
MQKTEGDNYLSINEATYAQKFIKGFKPFTQIMPEPI